ncbi:unnamed protein product [Adineta steineri]|uniref:Uncharacterized protein n=2 Tax=Adineta steineri TaxID=433720 RepID=A0A814JXE4_9BILA|nr:unnamed protein product [Adineta steineri]
MAFLRHYMPIDKIQDVKQNKNIRNVNVTTSDPRYLAPVQCGDIMEFNVNRIGKYDIFQVYRNGNDYYKIYNGFELCNITYCTPEEKRCMFLSLALDPDLSATEFIFCVIPSSRRGEISKTGICPLAYCTINHLVIQRRVQKYFLMNQKTNQKVYLHKGDTIELTWSSEDNITYRIEEKKYCPISGGLYTPEQTFDSTLAEGMYRKTFNELGMSFLFRYTDTNEIYDVIACIVNDEYKIKHILITDNKIQPNIIHIEQHDWIMFEWHGKHAQSIVQIEPFRTDKDQQSIEMTNIGEHFFWPNQPSRNGYMYHQFNETGVYCFKTADGQIGTIIVEPLKTIRQISIHSDRLIYKMNTKGLVQFNWNQYDTPEEPVLITIDSNSSRIPDDLDSRTGMFHCRAHQCTRIEPFFRRYFHSCETFLLNIPQYGFYNFAYSDNPHYPLISLIVKNGSHTHSVMYDEQNIFKPHTLVINRLDHVEFLPSSSRRGRILYQINEYDNQSEPKTILFQPQENSINYFIKEFSQLGIYYFSTDINNSNKQKSKQSSTHPLTIIVLPEIRFHRKVISKGKFNDDPIITTNTNDFVIWQFDKIISYNLVKLHLNDTYNDIMSCHDRATVGRIRQCLAVHCKSIPSGASYFCSPDFERVTGAYKNRLISTIIIDPPFNQNSFCLINQQFVPKILYVAESETVSWVLNDHASNHRIFMQSINNDNSDDRNISINQNIAEYVHGIHRLHTFNQHGKYIIKSDRFPDTTAIVVVYGDIDVARHKKRLQKPQIMEYIHDVSEFDTIIHLDDSNHHNTNIYYTLDGSPPTQHYRNVHLYNRNNGVHLHPTGLHVLRAYSTLDEKLSSFIQYSRPTFVLDNGILDSPRSIEPIDPPWDSCQIRLSLLLPSPYKIHVKVKIQPAPTIDLIDHFELYINDTAHGLIHLSGDNHWTIDNFVAGKNYEVYVVAYPKDHISHARRIQSNREEFSFAEGPPAPALNGDTPDDSKDRARMLYEKLRGLGNKPHPCGPNCIHPHTSFPGFPHYFDNSSGGTSTPSTDSNSNSNPNSDPSKPNTGFGGIGGAGTTGGKGGPTLPFSVELVVSIESEDRQMKK